MSDSLVYDLLVKKWGEDKVSETQEILADENEIYQKIEGKFIELDQDGKGETVSATKLEAKLLATVDDYLTRKLKAVDTGVPVAEQKIQRGLFE